MNNTEIHEALLKACHYNGITLQYAMYLTRLGADIIKLIEDEQFQNVPPIVWARLSKLLGVDMVHITKGEYIPYKPNKTSVVEFARKIGTVNSKFDVGISNQIAIILATYENVDVYPAINEQAFVMTVSRLWGFVLGNEEPLQDIGRGGTAHPLMDKLYATFVYTSDKMTLTKSQKAFIASIQEYVLHTADYAWAVEQCRGLDMLTGKNLKADETVTSLFT